MLKWFIAIVLTFSIGYYFGHSMSGGEPAPTPEAADNSEEVQTLKAKIAELEAKLRAAPVPQAKTSVLTASEPLPERKDEPPPPLEPPPVAPSSAPKPKWQAAEKNLQYLRSPADVEAFLKKTRIDDFMKEVQAVKPITEPDPIVDYLNGNFAGFMTTQSEVPGFNMTMAATISVQNEQLKGRVNIRLTRNGRPFSRNSNNGQIQNIQKFSEKSLAVLISSGDFFFQLYYVPQLETFDGNCYQQSKPGTMQFVGTVHLDKV